MLARQLAYITYVRGSMSTLQILLFHYFYGFMPPTLSREEPRMMMIRKTFFIAVSPFRFGNVFVRLAYHGAHPVFAFHFQCFYAMRETHVFFVS